MIKTFLIIGEEFGFTRTPRELFEGTRKEVIAYIKDKNERAKRYRYSYSTIKKVEGKSQQQKHQVDGKSPWWPPRVNQYICKDLEI